MITEDGWVDWARRVPDPTPSSNLGRNPVTGIVMHSVEGYEHAIPGVLDGVHNSWHFTILKDGRLWQHYSMWVRCWHSASAYGNQECVGIEHEGRGADSQGNRLPIALYEELTDEQVVTSKRLINEIADHQGFELIRKKTIWEHGEVGPSSCPNGRIPWDKLLAPEEVELPNINADGSQRYESDGYFVILYNSNIPVWRWGSTDGSAQGRVSKNFGGTWWWFRTLDENGFFTNPYFSEEEGD